jgi:glycosyltransferase involved in cell wall biosynthesis
MAHGLPCIGTNIDAMPEIIKEGQTGFLVPPENVDVLAEKIVALLRDPDLCKRMGREGVNHLQEDFSWDKLGDTIDACLNHLP